MGWRDDKGDFFVLPKRLEAELCTKPGFDKKQVIAVLLKHQYLITPSDGRQTISGRFYSLDAQNPDAENDRNSQKCSGNHALGANLLRR